MIEEQTTTTASGYFALDLDRCAAGTCAVNIERISFNLADFTLRGHGLSRIAVGRTGSLGGNLGSDGVLFFPKNSNTMDVRASLDGEVRQGPFDIASPMVGTVDDLTGVVRLRIALRDSTEGVAAAGTFVGRFQNRPPRAAFSAPPFPECTSPAGASVLLDASQTTDPDDATDIVEFLWLVDGRPVDTGVGPTLKLGIGIHEVQLVVSDRGSLTSAVRRQIVVRDTTPPSIAAFSYNGPQCLWPPNHDFVVLDAGRDVSAFITDACDPAPRLVIASALSDQPDNGTGDGDTATDVVVFSDRVCLRAERQGSVLAGRQYRVRLHAVDAAGNASDPEIAVRVAHDQRDRDCPRIPATEGVNDGDQRCRQQSGSTPPSGGGGCAAGRGAGANALLAVVMLLAIAVFSLPRTSSANHAADRRRRLASHSR